MKLKITIDGKAYDVDVEVAEEERRPERPKYYGPRPTAVSAPPPPAPLPAAAAAGAAVAVEDESKVVRAPVTGVVVRINTHPGQQIQANDPLVVLEAMKMETSITSPVAGKVKAIHAAAGEGVQAGQVLVEFE